MMRHLIAFCLCLTLAAPVALAEDKNPADYPMRILLLTRNETNFLHNRVLDEAKGEGRADLFERSEPHGFDFTFECSEKLKFPLGFSTFPAKWKKPGKELTVLMPVFGKKGEYFTCTFKADVKDVAYMRQNGAVREVPIAEYKAWMAAHDYDPEHGKETPTRKGPATDPQP